MLQAIHPVFQRHMPSVLLSAAAEVERKMDLLLALLDTHLALQSSDSGTDALDANTIMNQESTTATTASGARKDYPDLHRGRLANNELQQPSIYQSIRCRDIHSTTHAGNTKSFRNSPDLS